MTDILSKSGYFVYVDGVYLKTVYSDSFNLTFNDGKEPVSYTHLLQPGFESLQLHLFYLIFLFFS